MSAHATAPNDKKLTNRCLYTWCSKNE